MRSGGGRALYSGVWGNLAGVVPASAIFMGVYEPVKQARRCCAARAHPLWPLCASLLVLRCSVAAAALGCLMACQCLEKAIGGVRYSGSTSCAVPQQYRSRVHQQYTALVPRTFRHAQAPRCNVVCRMTGCLRPDARLSTR